MNYNANQHSNTQSTGAPPDGQPVQHQPQASSNELPVLAPNANQSVSYSISPYDSLHTHTFQLSASAGLVSSYAQPQNSQATVMIAAPQAQQMAQPMQHQQQVTQQSQYIPQAQAPMLISNPVYTQQTIVAAPGAMQGTMQPQHYYVTGTPIQMTQQQGLPQYTTTYLHQWQPNLTAPAQVTYTTDPLQNDQPQKVSNKILPRDRTSLRSPCTHQHLSLCLKLRHKLLWSIQHQ